MTGQLTSELSVVDAVGAPVETVVGDPVALQITV